VLEIYTYYGVNCSDERKVLVQGMCACVFSNCIPAGFPLQLIIKIRT